MKAYYSAIMFMMALSIPLSGILAQADNLPTGGQIVAGAGSISQSGNTLTITQNSSRMAANWQSFSIGQGHNVNFVQPSSSAVALNRVLGPDASVIQGALNANGKVFLINPNGILFSPSAQVNVGGLVASTYNLKTDDFMAGKYVFEGASSNVIINQGNIQIAPGGAVALIAAKITNTGSITADSGDVLLAAGGKVTLDLGGPVKLEVNEGALETLIEQNGAIRADGGQVLLTAKAAGELATSTINHTGITEARTLATGEKGEIILLGDLRVGSTHVSGTLDATAPTAGDGGLIETSAANVNISKGTIITAGAKQGMGGTWLIDPTDYTINATAAGNIANTLNTGTNVTVDTISSNSGLGSTGSGNGDITVNSDILKTAGGDADLTLQAANTIVLNAEIKSTIGKLNVLLDADNDGGTRDGGGVIIANKDISTNGGNLDFGTGATLSINGVSTLVGGDLYVGGTDKVNMATGGGNINLYGELIIANTEGVNFTTSNGDASFYGIINSGNKYEKISFSGDWASAQVDALNGTAGEDAVGDSYLATVTSRLENAVVGYTASYQTSWLGGERRVGVGTDALWRWTQGPEGLEDGGLGRGFFTQNGSATTNGIGGTAYDNQFENWSQGAEPNNTGGLNLTQPKETIVQIVNTQGQWNDLPKTGTSLPLYIRETNFDTANLEVDAGTGTTYFAKSIGGLKSINFQSYDANNPKPASGTGTSSTSVTPPQAGAIATIQGIANQSATNTASTGNSLAISAGSPFTGAGTAQDDSTQNGAASGVTQIGTLDIVRLNSSDFLSPSTGSSTIASGASDSGQSNAQNSSGDGSLDFSKIDAATTPSETTRVFVIDGGIHVPLNLTNNTDNDDAPKAP